MNRAVISEAGFTLVEILMVVFIISLSSGLILMSLPERAADLQEDARFLRRDVQVLSERAVLTGVPHAIEFDGRLYAGVMRQSGEWVPLNVVGHEISRNVTFRLNGLETEAEETPRIIFDPSGVPPIGRITLSSRGERLAIDLNPDALEARR